MTAAKKKKRRRPTLPAPPIRADVNIQSMPWMPLEISEVLRSLRSTAISAEAFRAAVLLRVISWHELPAASLPATDSALAFLLGMSLRRWLAIKEQALQGWYQCSDGRLYHSGVVAFALHAWAKKVKARASAAARWDANAYANALPAQSGRSADAMPTHSNGNGNGNGNGNVPEVEVARESAARLSAARSPSKGGARAAPAAATAGKAPPPGFEMGADGKLRETEKTRLARERAVAAMKGLATKMTAPRGLNERRRSNAPT